MVVFRIRRARRAGSISPLYAMVRRYKESRKSLAVEERRVRVTASKGAERKIAFTSDVNAELVRQSDAIHELARKHDVHPDKVRKFLKPCKIQHNKDRVLNTWNVHLNATARRINDRAYLTSPPPLTYQKILMHCFTALPKGQKKSAAEIRKIAKQTYQEWKDLPAEERSKTLSEFEDTRTKARAVVRSEPKMRNEEARQVQSDVSLATNPLFLTNDLRWSQQAFRHGTTLQHAFTTCHRALGRNAPEHFLLFRR